jgi:hypothetical protein
MHSELRRAAQASTVTFERLGLAAAALAAVLCAASTILALRPRVTKVEEHVGDLQRLGERIERQRGSSETIWAKPWKPHHEADS